MAPLSVKLSVLDVCVVSSISYGCESWAVSRIKSAEVMYRLGLKRALSIRECTPTEIVYLESNRLPLYIRIEKQQLNFWKTLTKYLAENQHHPLQKLINQGRDLGSTYLAYYESLSNNYGDPSACVAAHTREFSDCTKRKFEAIADPGSPLGTYNIVNPELQFHISAIHMLEFERILVSRYRCGSHNLRVESGRLCNPKIPRENRICICGLDIQTLHHCLFDCPLLQDLRNEFLYESVADVLAGNDAPKILMKLEAKLKI